MYTNWLLFPAAFGLMLDFIDFGYGPGWFLLTSVYETAIYLLVYI